MELHIVPSAEAKIWAFWDRFLQGEFVSGKARFEFPQKDSDDFKDW
jgi:hypothetical protein